MKGVQIMDAREAALELLQINKTLAAQVASADTLIEEYSQYLEFACRANNVAAIQTRASFELFKKAETLITAACTALEDAGDPGLAEAIRCDLRTAMDEALMETGAEGTKH